MLRNVSNRQRSSSKSHSYYELVLADELHMSSSFLLEKPQCIHTFVYESFVVSISFSHTLRSVRCLSSCYNTGSEQDAKWATLQTYSRLPVTSSFTKILKALWLTLENLLHVSRKAFSSVRMLKVEIEIVADCPYEVEDGSFVNCVCMWVCVWRVRTQVCPCVSVWRVVCVWATTVGAVVDGWNTII